MGLCDLKHDPSCSFEVLEEGLEEQREGAMV
jgi:hypothetical protein